MEMVGLRMEPGATGGKKQQPDKEWEGEVQGNREQVMAMESVESYLV